MFIFNLYKAMTALEGVLIYLHSFFNLGARRGSVETPRPGRFTPVNRSGAHCTEGYV